MGRPAKGKKNAQNDQLMTENTAQEKLTLEKEENPNSKVVEPDNNEETTANGDGKVKSSTKTTKSAKPKKESTTEAAAKSTKKVKEVVEEPAEKETNKRGSKKKLDDKVETETASKRSRKEPVDKKGEKLENGSAANKRKGKAPEEPVDAEPVEPENKRSKKTEAAAKVDDKKKPVKSKKAAEEPKVVENVAAEEKKPKGKATKKQESKEESEPEKPAPRKARAKKDEEVSAPEPTEKLPEKKGKGKPPKGKAADKVSEEPQENGKSSTTPQKKKSGKAVEKDKSDAPEEKLKNVKAATKKEEKVVEKSTSSPKAAKGNGAKSGSKPDTKKLQNSIESDLNIDFGIDKDYNLKIAMWNLSGLRSCVDKGGAKYFKHENPDIICLNEIKVPTEDDIPYEIKLEGYHKYWNIAKGMPGVAILTKQMPIEVFYDLPGEFSQEKRLITAEFKKFYLVCTYVVNAGRGLKTLDKRLEWNEAFDNYIKDLDKKKPVIIAGDMNVAHNEIDLANPKTNKKSAGFTIEEREGFTKLLSYGFVDTFRHFYPDQKDSYTFWSYMNNARAKNVGWRLDYFIASERLMDKVKDNVIRSTIKGSDHCPIVLFLEI